ncbi:MAG: glycosyltransferase [Lactobacillaceae bacterium]|jgi:glycosyltransferase involved in cell wall biosynthesis|nr:glycosyltransferase [Lactobacillaceae bacterium]
MKHSLVTVAVPTYNLAGYIDKTLKSISNQTYENMEILVVDDDSNDSTVRQIKEAQEKDSRIRLIETGKHIGVGNVRNRLIDEAKGEYFIFVDGDDIVSPLFVYLLVHALEQNPDIDVSSVAFDWGGSLPYEVEYREPKWNYIDRKQMFKWVSSRGNDITGMVWNKGYRMSALKKSGVRFDEFLQLAEDHLWIAELIASPEIKPKFIYTSETYYYKVNRSSSIIHTATSAMRSREREIDAQIVEIGKHLPHD